MTLLDAFALITFLVGGPGATQVRALLREGPTAVATANLAETLDVAKRTYGIPIEEAINALEPLMSDALEVVPLDAEKAYRAAALRARHYDRTTRPLSLADAVLLATARSGDKIATADPHVLAAAADEGIATIALPASSS